MTQPFSAHASSFARRQGVHATFHGQNIPMRVATTSPAWKLTFVSALDDVDWRDREGTAWSEADVIPVFVYEYLCQLGARIIHHRRRRARTRDHSLPPNNNNNNTATARSTKTGHYTGKFSFLFRRIYSSQASTRFTRIATCKAEENDEYKSRTLKCRCNVAGMLRSSFHPIPSESF